MLPYLTAGINYLFLPPSSSSAPSQWFTDYLSDLCLDEHLQRYLDIRVFLTNIDSPPDELASALLQLGLKTAGESCIGRRPSQPQLNNLYSMTSYGIPDFDGLLECKLARMFGWGGGGGGRVLVIKFPTLFKNIFFFLLKTFILSTLTYGTKVGRRR